MNSTQPPTAYRSHWTKSAFAQISDGFASFERGIAPLLDFAIRLFIAVPIVNSGLIKLLDWDTALMLSANEYPLEWLDPVAPACLGVGVELIGGMALLIGLGTRFAATALLALTGVVFVEYVRLPVQFPVGVLLIWFVVMGPRSLSIDHLVTRGLAGSAVPFGATLAQAFSSTTRVLTPLAMMSLRAWLAAVTFFWGMAYVGDADAMTTIFGAPHTFPVLEAHGTTLGVLMVTASMALLFGVAARLTSLVLMLTLTGAGAMSVAEHGVMSYLYLQLALILVRGQGPVSLDYWIDRQMHQMFPLYRDLSREAVEALPHMVIVGAGFGGIACANALRHSSCRVTVIDRNNYHLFQPLLYQVATATLSLKLRHPYAQ